MGIRHWPEDADERVAELDRGRPLTGAYKKKKDE